MTATPNIAETEALPKGADVVVVGGGVTGLSAAWWLARDGLKVIVVEKGIVGAEASSRNGGGASHYHSPLFHEEQRLWPLMDELLGYATEYRRERLILALTPHQLDHYRYMARMHRELGYRADELDAKAMREAVPLAGEHTLGGVHIFSGGHANPQRTVQAFAWALQDLGGVILQHASATRFRTANGRISAVETTRGLFDCDAAVLAAGPHSDRLLEPLGVRLPLSPARAEMIVTEPAPLMAIGGVDGNGLYGRQTLRGNLAYGGGPHEWIDQEPRGPFARPSTPVLRNIAKRVAELLPRAAHLRVIRSWSGVVETTPDGRPVIDRLSGVGFGLSPASGHAIRDLVVNRVCSFADLSNLRLSRFDGLADGWREERGWVAEAMKATSASARS